MLRVCFLFGVIVLVTFCSIFAAAQEKPLTLQKIPELSALMAEIHQLLESLPDTEKVPFLFQLLSLELRLADKQPAQNTIRQVLKLIPSIEKESMQAQIIEAVAFAQADLGGYLESVKTLNLIAKPSLRAQKQFNVAEKIIKDAEKVEKSNADKNETVNQFDVTDLLQKSLAGAVEVKDAGLESLVSAILARELAKQGKIDESKIFFEKARKKAKELEDVEEQKIIALIVQSLIFVDRQAEALAMIETVANEEDKLHLFKLAAIMFAGKGKIADAENILKVLKFENDEMKDNFVGNIILNFLDSTQTITAEQILTLTNQTGSSEFRERLLQDICAYLLKNNRNDIAEELVKQSESQLLLHHNRLKLLVDAGKFDEAIKIIETHNFAWKRQAVLQLIAQQLITTKVQQEDDVFEELLNLLSSIYSEEEQEKITQLQQEAENVFKITNTDERLMKLNEVLQSQLQITDIRGSRKTLRRILEIIEKLHDPHKVILSQLDIANLQIELRDKMGVKESLNRLQQYLDEIKDVRILKGLINNGSVQSEPTNSAMETSSQPVLKLNQLADEIESNDNLFQVYIAIMIHWYMIGENDEAKKSFQKAKDIADSESDAKRRVDKFCTLLKNYSPFLDSSL
jgi:hypothetical protein